MYKELKAQKSTSFLKLTHVERRGISITVNSNCIESHPLGCLDDTTRDLTPVGDQDFGKQLAALGGVPLPVIARC